MVFKKYMRYEQVKISINMFMKFRFFFRFFFKTNRLNGYATAK